MIEINTWVFIIFCNYSEYEIPLPREELKTLTSLREKWKELLLLAEKVFLYFLDRVYAEIIILENI